MVDSTPMRFAFLAAAMVANDPNVKVPEKGIVQYNESALPQEMISDLLFDDVGGQELILVSRWDTIDGQDVPYSLISDLNRSAKQFNSSGILTNNEGKQGYFRQFSLDIGMRLTEINSLNDAEPGISLNADGDLVIDFDYIGPAEQAEVQIVNSGTIYTF